MNLVKHNSKKVPEGGDALAAKLAAQGKTHVSYIYALNGSSTRCLSLDDATPSPKVHSRVLLEGASYFGSFFLLLKYIG